MNKSIWIGTDPREQDACKVARGSLLRLMSEPIIVNDLILSQLQDQGLYTRPTMRNEAGRLIDVLSIRKDYDGSISTEHAITRFLVPKLAKTGWALFTDGDVLFRDDVNKLFNKLDPAFPLYCVKHKYAPAKKTKMDGQLQTIYDRKNWSSVMVFNCDHPANAALTVEAINTLPGRDLHRFCWLADEEIGSLHSHWNWLAGHSSILTDPSIVHFTEGPPDLPGYEDCIFADEWRAELARC